MKEKIQKVQQVIKSNPIYIYIFFYFVFLVILSFFRHASADESYYLRETLLISELFKNGEWVGNYSVGLHGFLFKIPVALIYILLGRPSVFVATLFTILLNISSLVIFYNLVKRLFRKENYASWATVLLSVVFHFLSTSISFNRDIPAVFAVLLFLFLFFNKANTWKIGISLFLLLEAKEHVFLTVAPVFAIFAFIDHFYFSDISSRLEKLKSFLSELFKGYFLSILWIILMFTTSIVPMNMFIASISGQVNYEVNWNRSQFSTMAAIDNLMGSQGREIPLISIPECLTYDDSNQASEKIRETDIISSNSPKICTFVNVLNVIIGYIGKILYPRTFSFISIPKIIVLPTIIIALSLQKKWFKEKDKKVILPIILILNLLFYILRASHGRYLLGVAPIFALFFIMFLREGLKKPVYFRNTLIFTTIFVFLGLFFESTFFIQKVILEILLLILFWSIWLFRKNKKLLNISTTFFYITLVSGMFLTNLAYSYSIGQISSYIKYGNNRQSAQIMDKLKKEEIVWINDYGSGELINYYRKNLSLEPEWTWELKGSIPKKNLMKTFSTSNTFSSEITNLEKFKKYLLDNRIEKVVLVVSTISDETFVNQKRLEELLLQDWLLLIEKIQLKNKEMYIFKFIYSVEGNNDKVY